MLITEETEKSWADYVLGQYPKEACAFIVDGCLYPVPNLSLTPETTFRVDAIHRLQAQGSGRVEAFLHSHPYKLEDSPFSWSPEWATTADMTSWIADNIPWGIVSTDGEGLSPILWYDDSMEAMAPLEGREFVSGKHDCYSLVRDYYRAELGIHIPNFARGMDWWYRGENLYEDNFRLAGFTEIPMAEATVNDSLLMKLVGSTISHSAVIVGTNEILHHCIKRLSGRDSMVRWARQTVKAVRYTG